MISQKGLVLDIEAENYEARGGIIRDKSRNHNDGIIHGARGVSEPFCSYFSFDGVNDYIDCGNDTSLKIDDISFTLEAWIKPASQLNTSNRYVVMATYSPGWLMDLADDNNQEGYRFYNGNVAYKYIPSGGLISLDWTHWVITRDLTTNQLKIYLNGELKQTWSITSVVSSANPIWIGKYSNGWYFNGTIDDVHIYNRSLSKSEIKNNMYSSKIYKMLRGIANIL